MSRDKKILVITSRSFYKDYRVLKSIYNLLNFSKNISIVQLLNSKDSVTKNSTVFNLDIHSIKPNTDIDKEKKYSNKIKKFEKDDNFK